MNNEFKVIEYISYIRCERLIDTPLREPLKKVSKQGKIRFLLKQQEEVTYLLWM